MDRKIYSRNLVIPDFHGQISMGSYIVILETKEPNEPCVISFNTKLTLLLGNRHFPNCFNRLFPLFQFYHKPVLAKRAHGM